VDVRTSPRWTRLWHTVLDLLFPPRCIDCRQPGEWLCSACLSRVGRIEGSLCSRCGRPLHLPDARIRAQSLPARCTACQLQRSPLSSQHAVFFFEGIIRHAIHDLKYRQRQVLAQPLGKLMAGYVRGLEWEDCTIAPVPLSAQRVRERGYNQSALLARVLAGLLGWPLLEKGLVRWRDTCPQVGLARSERLKNVSDAFRWEGVASPPVPVLLLDDVSTTGATLKACAEALQAGGASDVRGLVLARPREGYGGDA
jgi:ComF family protein